ncbi:MAG: FtsW/RodA/SpoVE family cell cycle protein, partial [Selenomonadaceae bacterium]|nr:FtsW/RodA/SpoVE family cell cycle protein [Selenomonadaceae bacterium]
KDEYGQIPSMGIMILIVGQAIANLLMVGGLIPVVGVPLPFISYGGTSLIVTMAAVGMLANIGRQGEKEQRRKAEAAAAAEAAAEAAPSS